LHASLGAIANTPDDNYSSIGGGHDPDCGSVVDDATFAEMEPVLATESAAESDNVT